MGTLTVRHNDLVESMEETLRDFFGDSVLIKSHPGTHGETVTNVTGANVDADLISDIERLEWVLSVN